MFMLHVLKHRCGCAPLQMQDTRYSRDTMAEDSMDVFQDSMDVFHTSPKGMLGALEGRLVNLSSELSGGPSAHDGREPGVRGFKRERGEERNTARATH
jgi:hypothetical protein